MKTFTPPQTNLQASNVILGLMSMSTQLRTTGAI